MKTAQTPRVDTRDRAALESTIARCEVEIRRFDGELVTARATVGLIERELAAWRGMLSRAQRELEAIYGKR